MFEKIIQLQKKANQQNFYQSITMQTKLGVSLIDLLSSKERILDKLKSGVLVLFKFNLLSKLDDILFSVIKYYEESQKKERKKEDKKEDDGEKQRQQKHLIHILSVILKSKMSAKFHLEQVEDFQNNLLSWVSSEDLQTLLQLEPIKAMPFMKPLKKAYNDIKQNGRQKDKIPETIQAMSEMANSFTKAIGINALFEDMI